MLMLLLACAGESQDDSGTNGDPFVAILTPAADAIVCGSPLVVEVEVRNLTLVAPVTDTADAEPGTGHVDIMLNGQDAAMIWDMRAEISEVEDGPWQLKVELSNADHTPVEPYAGDLIYITVSAATCD